MLNVVSRTWWVNVSIEILYKVIENISVSDCTRTSVHCNVIGVVNYRCSAIRLLRAVRMNQRCLVRPSSKSVSFDQFAARSCCFVYGRPLLGVFSLFVLRDVNRRSWGQSWAIRFLHRFIQFVTPGRELLCYLACFFSLSFRWEAPEYYTFKI